MAIAPHGPSRRPCPACSRRASSARKTGATEKTGSPDDGVESEEGLHRPAWCLQRDQVAGPDPAQLGAGHHDELLTRVVLGEGDGGLITCGRLVEDTGLP